MKSALRHPAGRKGRSPHPQALRLTALFLLLLAASGCAPILVAAPTATPASLAYHNSEYGFTFSLPPDWSGYSVIVSQWTGTVNDPNKGDVPVLQGPLISIRHPLWREQEPRQDIPIMIFTPPQWDALQRGEFQVSPAPIGPRELGRNAGHVFALPARYNYAFPAGWQEVDQILSGHPLRIP